jgi:3-deoxy-manno-octulosonate cytidylyltransferase (CMP-KDO synthetase)
MQINPGQINPGQINPGQINPGQKILESSPEHPKKIIIIPARLDSTRLPEKVLADIAGKSMIQHTYERALLSGVDRVLIATDSKKVFCVAEGFGAEVFLNDESLGPHESGTSRIAEAAKVLGLSDHDLVLNLQADEPLIPPENISQVFENIEFYKEASVATLCEKITTHEELMKPSCVKVVFDEKGFALYFSRSVIPYLKNPQDFLSEAYFRHVGLYCFRAGFLKTLDRMGSTWLERQESLEQLSFLYRGHKIHVAESKIKSPMGVDLPSDIFRVESFLKQKI